MTGSLGLFDYFRLCSILEDQIVDFGVFQTIFLSES